VLVAHASPRLRSLLPLMFAKPSVLIVALSAIGSAVGKKYSCLQCMAIQDATYRLLNLNITAQQKLNGHVRVDFESVQSELCESDVWKSMSYSKEVRKGCASKVKEHVATSKIFWGDEKDGTVTKYLEKSVRYCRRRARRSVP
jgi:hypothetical protein